MAQSAGGRRLVFALLGAVLVVALLGATLVVGAERTVMNPANVADELDEAGVYESMAADMASEVEPDNETKVSVGLANDTEQPPIDEMVRSVVTPAYVQGEVEGNLEDIYAYLEGEQETLSLTFDLVPVKAGISEEMAAWVASLDPAEISPRMGDLAESESSFRETRESFTDDQLQRIQNETQREHTRPELLEIYDDRRDEVRDRMVSDLESRVADSGNPESVQAASVAYGTVGIDALVAENASYDAFLDRENASRHDLADAVGGATRQRLDEDHPDQRNVTGDLDESAMAGLQTARTGVSIAGVLLVVLPLVALASAGAIGYRSRRRSRALWRIGIPVLVAGGLGVAVGLLLSRLLSGAMRVDATDPSPVGEALLGVVDAVSGAVTVQSLALVVLGLVLVLAGVAVGRGMLPVDDVATDGGRDDDEATTTDADAESTDSEPTDES